MSYSNYANYINALQTNQGLKNPCCCDPTGVVQTGPPWPTRTSWLTRSSGK